VAYKVEHDADRGIILLAYDGDVTTQDIMAATSEGISLGRKAHLKTFLVDYSKARLKGSKADAFHFMDDLSSIGLKKDDRVAVIISSDADIHEFAGLVSDNRGWANLKYFKEPGLAKAWLGDL